MKLLTASLTEKALDWALAVALQYAPQIQFNSVFVPTAIKGISIDGIVPFDHADSDLCLGLIASEHGKVLKVEAMRHGMTFQPIFWAEGCAGEGLGRNQAYGKTLAEAVARCIVQMRSGDEVDVPDELCGEQKPHKPTEPQCLYDQHGGDLEDELAIS